MFVSLEIPAYFAQSHECPNLIKNNETTRLEVIVPKPTCETKAKANNKIEEEHIVEPFDAIVKNQNPQAIQ